MDGDDPICYYKTHVKHFLSNKKFKTEKDREKHKNGNIPMQWVQFVPDQCVNKVKEPHKAGIFSFRMELHDCSLDNTPEF